MREIRPSGSEGGGGLRASPYLYHLGCGRQLALRPNDSRRDVIAKDIADLGNSALRSSTTPDERCS